MNFELLYDKNYSQAIPLHKADELRQFLQKKHGWVYIAKSTDPNNHLLKIGRTGKSPYERAKSLSTTGVLYDYEIIFSLEVFNQYYVEKEIHKLLKKHRVGKEFFSVTESAASQAAQKIANIEEELLGRFLDVKMLKDDLELVHYALK